MIFTERTIRVTDGESQINTPIILYRGDKNIKLRFRIVDSPYTYSKTVDNIIETTEAPYAQLVIQTPNDNPPIFSDIVATENGYVTFIITSEMVDEIPEVGSYTFQIRLLDDEQRSRITIPEVVNGVEVREPIAIEGASTTNEVDKAMADYAVVTAAEVEDVFDSSGNYNETTWGNGDVITASKLNKIEDGITGVNQKIESVSATIPDSTSDLTNDSGFITSIPSEYITETELNGKGYATETFVTETVNNASISGGYTHPSTHPASMITGLSTVATTGNYNDLTDKPIIPTRTSQLSNDSDFVDSAFVSRKIADASLSGGNVDLSNYVTKETGNANQITFADGQTFQAKLDNGTLKGEKGDRGERGEQGIQGPKGNKGDTGVKGQDGLTTNIVVNGTTYTHSNGTITLPNYPTIPASLPANGGNADTVNHFHIWQGTQAEYNSISSKNANTIYLIKEG